MKEFILPKKTLLLWQIRCFALGVILFLLALIIKDIIFLPILVLKVFGIIDIVVTIILTTIYMPFLFKTCKVMVINKGVVVERGIIFKNTQSNIIKARFYKYSPPRTSWLLPSICPRRAPTRPY